MAESGTGSRKTKRTARDQAHQPSGTQQGGSASTASSTPQSAPSGPEAAPQPAEAGPQADPITEYNLEPLRQGLTEGDQATLEQRFDALQGLNGQYDLAYDSAYNKAWKERYQQARQAGQRDREAHEAASKHVAADKTQQNIAARAHMAMQHSIDGIAPAFMSNLTPGTDEYNLHYDQVSTALHRSAAVPRQEMDTWERDNIQAVSPEGDGQEQQATNPEQAFTDARQARHKAFAERQNSRVYNRNAQKRYEEAADEYYDDKLKAHLEQFAEQMESGDSDLTSDQIQELAQKVNEIGQHDAQQGRELLIAEGGNKTKWQAKYESLTPKQKRAVKALGIVASVGVVAGTGGAAAAFGASGFAVGMATAGVASTSAFGRSYMLGRSKLFQEPSDKNVFTLQDWGLDAQNATKEQVIAAGIKALRNKSAEYIEDGNRVKKQAFRGAMGASAVAGTIGIVGGVAGDAIDANNWYYGRAGEWMSDKVGDVFQGEPVQAEGGHVPGAPSPGDGAPVPPTPAEMFNGSGGSTELTPEGLDAFKHWIDGYEVQQGDTIWGLSERFLQEHGIAYPTVEQVDALKDDIIHDTGIADGPPNSTAPGTEHWLFTGETLDAVPGDGGAAGPDAGAETGQAAATEAAGTVSPGEGWYSTFQEMGIPQSDWQPLLEQVGPQLVQETYADGIPVAYEQGGQYFINMSHSGDMPQSVLDYIRGEHMMMQETGTDTMQNLAQQIDTKTFNEISHIPADVDTEAWFANHGFNHLWIDINHDASVASELQAVNPGAFSLENGTLQLNPDSHINDKAWKILAEHMSKPELQSHGVAVT